MLPSPLITRYAPTPSGYLHRGNAFNFVLTYLYAQKHKGSIILRIDDIDNARVRSQYVDDIFYTLDWLGLSYTHGPTSPTDFYQNYSQHLRLERYYALLETLKENNHLFACTCSRSQVGMLYNGACLGKNIPFDMPEAAWRLKTTPTQTFTDYIQGTTTVSLADTMPYVVVRGKNGLPAYQIVSVVDDVAMGVNFIVRGDDLLASTATQVYIASLEDEYQAFKQTTFIHHPLVLDSNDEKLSKSAGSEALQTLYKANKPPTPIYRSVALYLNLPSDITTLNELTQAFNNA